MIPVDGNALANHDAISSATRQQALHQWYASPAGQRVWRNEQRLLSHHLPGLFGYHLLSLGVDPSLPVAESSPIHHRMVFSQAQTSGAVACTQFHALPLESECVDVAVLHHALDYSEQPHQLLRETARVLIPFGHVLVFGFQRWSALGMQQSLQARFHRQDPVASHDFLGLLRLQDWLKLLDFDIIKARHTVYVPPQLGEAVQRRCAWFERLAWGAQLPFGSVYFVLARKTVAGVRPVVSSWERLTVRNPLAAALVPQPVVPAAQHRRKNLH